MTTRSTTIWPFIALLISWGWNGPLAIQAADEPRTYPLDHRQPTGMAGRWGVLTKPDLYRAMQGVRITLPSQGEVTFYSGSPQGQVVYPAPALAGMTPGYTYRFKLSHMPEFPGVEIFPTVELVDRTHPPAGLEEQFPLPIEITADEIELVLQDRMITKVIYLEQPDRAAPFAQDSGMRTETLSPRTNLLQAADQRGRPIAIVRIGGRIPDPNSPDDEFHSSSPLNLNPISSATEAALAR